LDAFAGHRSSLAVSGANPVLQASRSTALCRLHRPMARGYTVTPPQFG
jgi:hypothetical protein